MFAPEIALPGREIEKPPKVSVVVPIYNEASCLTAMLDELFLVLNEHGDSFEVLAVDDGSTDETPARLSVLQARWRQLRVLRLERNTGQSAAFGAGFQHARGRITVLMDADGQNDPHDIPALLRALNDADIVCGFRLQRQDSWEKRIGSRLANAVRRRVLHDGIRDTGCSLKAARTELLRRLPMQIAGMHRFIPALLQMEGACVVQQPVHHRPRLSGRSKYSNLGRLAVTVRDLRGVAWMRSRYRAVSSVEVAR